MASTLSNQEPFFITRQSANLMEDMERQLSESAAICVIYGEAGVGKTRLLAEFSKNRLPDVHKHTLSFNKDGSCDDITQGSTGNQRAMLISALQHLKHGSILVLDHFEQVQTDLSIRLFALWNKNASNHNLGLIIATEPSTLEHLGEMSSQFDHRMKSVEMLPLGKQEQLAFIGARVCQTAGLTPKLSAGLKRKLKQTRGLYTSLETLLAQYSDDIQCMDRSRGSFWTTPWVWVPMVLLGVMIIAWWIWPQQNDHTVVVLEEHQSLSESTIPVEKPQEQIIELTQLESKPDPINSVEPNPVENNNQPEQSDRYEEKAESEQLKMSSSQLPLIEEAEPIIEEVTASLTSDSESNRVKKESVPNKNDDKSVIDSEDEPIIEPVTVKLTDIATPLELRLRATEIWLSENAPSTASLQLMLLSKNPNPEQALNRYLEKMENQGMNLDQFYIYTRLQDDRPVYGVLYGSYINRSEAVRQKKQLPAELGVKQPLPRTIRGIRDEISSN